MLIKDKTFIEALFTSPKLKAVLDRPTTTHSFKNEFSELKAMIFNDSTWIKLQNFVAVEAPIRKMLRLTDGQQPSLSFIAPLFETTKQTVLSKVVELDQKGYNLEKKIKGYF